MRLLGVLSTGVELMLRLSISCKYIVSFELSNLDSIYCFLGGMNFWTVGKARLFFGDVMDL